MHLSSKAIDKDMSEAELFDIKTEYAMNGYPPKILGAPSAYFCMLNQEINLGESKTIPLVLNVEHIFVDKRIITDNEKMSISFDPVARIGRKYASVGEEIEC